MALNESFKEKQRGACTGDPSIGLLLGCHSAQYIMLDVAGMRLSNSDCYLCFFFLF